MAICPTCLTKYPDGTSTCTEDGAALAPDEAFAYVDRDLQPGDHVGEYRIEGKLGQGGFGAVYKAVHPVIGKFAAVKVLSRQFSANPQMVSRFISEARAVNQIRHRNIIDVFAFGQIPDGRQYYVMELLDGMPFDRYLRDKGRLTLDQALPILRGIARAMDAAHAKGILHRDLKPENVYLVFDEDGGVMPKLLDFGLAKLLTDPSGSHKTKTGTPMGTPYYMSPEQCRGKDVDARTDVYAFGAMVFEVLTGRVPYDGDSPMDILLKHMTATVPAASELALDLPAAVDAPIARMLAKEPTDRPATIGRALDELAAAVGLAVAGAPRPAEHAVGTMPTMVDVAARPAQTFLGGAEADIERPAARPSRTKIALAATVVGLLGAIAAAGIALRHPSPARSGLVPSAASDGRAPASASAASVDTEKDKPAAPVEAKPTTVAIRVIGAPPGATVLADGKALGAAPGPFTVAAGAPVKLTITAKGYRARELTVTPTADVAVDAALEKQVAPAVKNPAIPSDLESFDGKK